MDAIAEIAQATEEKAPQPSEMTAAQPPESGVLPEETPEQKARRLHRPLPSGANPEEKRGRSRKTKEEKAAEEAAENKATLEAQIRAKAEELADYKITGRQLGDGFIYFNVTMFGPEFNYFPVVKDEHGNVVKDERAEFYKIGGDMAEQYGWRRLPPYIQIALLLTSYYGIRAAMPPVRQRFGGWFKGAFTWIGQKWSKLWHRKPKETTVAALAPVPSPDNKDKA